MNVRSRARVVVCLLLALFLGGMVPLAHAGERTFKVSFYCSCKKCCGRYSPQKGGTGNTSLGNAPVAYRTVAVGDPALLGKWIYFPDLGNWALAADTGVVCPSRPRKGQRKVGCVAQDQVDVFVGGPEMHKYALRMGRMEWTGIVQSEMN